MRREHPEPVPAALELASVRVEHAGAEDVSGAVRHEDHDAVGPDTAMRIGAAAGRGHLVQGILLALLCALIGNVGFLCKHRGAVAAPDVDMRHPLRSAVDLFRSKGWSIGWAVAEYPLPTVDWGISTPAFAAETCA